MMKESETITITRTLYAPNAETWKALTDISDLKQWLPFFSDFKPEVGFETTFMLGLMRITNIPTRWKYSKLSMKKS
jgi:uncharacterized protein YndB with AHSA1/START domain